MNKITIDISGICNLSCAFCYQDLDGSVLPEDEILAIADENPELDAVEIGGGEPLLHRDILDIVKGIRGRGKKVHISTNATVIPEGFLELEERVREGTQIQASLHASNPRLYHHITGDDSFDKVIGNICRIKSKYATLITSAIYKENFSDVPDLIDLAGSLGLLIRINLVFPVRKGKDVELAAPRQIDRLKGYLLGQHLQKRDAIDSPLLHTNNCTALERYYGIAKQGTCLIDCAGKQYVSPRGERYACEFIQENTGGTK